MSKNKNFDKKENVKPAEAPADDVSLDSLSEEELEKLTNPEADASDVEVEAPVADEPVKAEPTPTPKAEPVVQIDADKKAEELSVPLKLVRDRLESYVRDMAPNVARTPEECAPYQVGLYRTMRSVIAMTDADFRTGMRMIISYFREYRSAAFYETYVARGFQHVNLPKDDRVTFERLIRLFTVAADINNVSEVSKHVDVPLVVKNINNSEQQQRVLHFFKVG